MRKEAVHKNKVLLGNIKTMLTFLPLKLDHIFKNSFLIFYDI